MSVCAQKGVFSYCLPYHIAHGIRRLPHHIRRGVGISTEGEPCRVVSQGAGQGLHVHPILQGQRCEGMPEIVESDPRQPRSFQYLVEQTIRRDGTAGG